MDETIHTQSNIGKRLKHIKKSEAVMLTVQGKAYPVVGEMSMGRDRKNDIPIEDKLASRHHAVIQKIKEAYFIKDLSSTNGTWLNGNKVPADKYMRLKIGDIIRIGRTELTIL